MKYDAFISYRHTPLDMEIAKKLHRALETFTIPIAVQKRTGKKKIRRVFRDQEELPIGSNLTDKINDALEESEYLIVVCSPETPGSEWVQKEIDTFIKLHGHSRLLAILIDGEPEDSFPPAILKDENGKSVEPLAADIRGSSRAERNRKFKTELLRLAAPIIGCSFDDLRQRHRERLIRKAIGYVTATALITGGAGAAFGIYSASVAKEMELLAQEKGTLAGNNAQLALEITQEFREKQINQSRFYATESLTLLSQGFRKQAALVACMGLPSQGVNRPYVAEAEYALSSALHAYDDGESRDFYRNLEHELPVSKMWGNRSNSRLITLDFCNYVHVWDTTTWEELVCVVPDPLENNYQDKVVVAGADEEHVYVLTEKHFYAYDLSGQLIYCTDKPDGSDYNGGLIADNDGIAFLSNGSILQVLQLSDGSISSRYDNRVPGIFNDKLRYDHNMFVIGHNDAEESLASITIFQPEQNYLFDIELSEAHLLQFCITDNGNIAVLSCASDALWLNGLSQITLDLYTPDGEKLWSRDFTVDLYNTGDYRIVIRTHAYPTENGDLCTIVCTVEDEAFTFDESDGSELMHTNLPANAVAILLSQNSYSGFFAYQNGDIQLADMETGKLYTSDANQHVAGLRDLLVINNAFIARTANDKNVNVIAYQEAPDLEKLPAVEDRRFAAGVSPNGDYYVLENLNNNEEYEFFDPDGNKIYNVNVNSSYAVATAFCGNLFVVVEKDFIHFIDPLAKTMEDYEYSEWGIDTLMLTNARFSSNGDYVALWNFDELNLIDLKNKCCIYQTTTESMIGEAIPDESGTSILISEKNKNLYILEVEGENTRVFDDDLLQQVTNVYSYNYLAASRDGKYAAMCCIDQKVRIIDLQNGELSGELPMQIADRTLLQFSEDGKYLFMQGNDYVFRIWDIEKEEYINSFPTTDFVRFTVYDEEDKKLALITGYSLYLLDLQDYGLCAYVPECIAYIKGSNAFIQKHNQNIYRCYYKDYLTLIEETERQFPGAKLTNAEIVEYNIN